MKNKLIGLATLTSMKQSMATSVASAAAAISIFGDSSIFNPDPIQVFIVIGGMVVVVAYSKPTSRIVVLANLLISLFLGLFAADFAAAAATSALPKGVEVHPRLAAGLLAGGWPWFAGILWMYAKRWAERGDK
jgi:hypothetical protein